MSLIVASLIIAAAITWGAFMVAREIAVARGAAARGRALELMTTFAPALAAADADPRALLIWQPLARTARRLCPDEFGALDRAAGGVFPFSADRIQAAHARWSADWLAWERSHDAIYKLKAAEVEQQLVSAGTSPLVRARLEAVEREKLEHYQHRYEEYIRVGKALQALIETATGHDVR